MVNSNVSKNLLSEFTPSKLLENYLIWSLEVSSKAFKANKDLIAK